MMGMAYDPVMAALMVGLAVSVAGMVFCLGMMARDWIRGYREGKRARIAARRS